MVMRHKTWGIKRNMDKIEKIGKITLDYEYYPGEDYYCDGLVEDELLNIVKNHAPVEFPAIIEERGNWPVLYHLSDQRENIVNWLPITKDMKVLEIGSGCGAITGALSAKAGSVTSIDLSRKRSLINAYRHEECENVTIKVGNFKDIEPKLEKDFDCALLIGVLEYGESYIGGQTPFESFIKTIRKHVKKGGAIIIAIENRYGMKYWAGCREDHNGEFFSGIENYPNGSCAKTFSRKELEKICKNAGEKKVSFYYPYPDYKFMTTLYSDARLPLKGELINNNRNYDRDRMKLFDEATVFDGIIEEGLFPFYSNSYLLVLGQKPETEYIRYSNDRAKEYQIATEIVTVDKQRIVKKQALCEEAYKHISRIKPMYELLAKRYQSGRLIVNPLLDIKDGCATFAYETGTPLSELLDAHLMQDDIDGFIELFFEFVDRISENAQMLIADYDMVFSNILVDGDTWKLLDYEWSYEKQIPTKELAFRALYCYLMEDEKRNKFNFDLILQRLDITPDEADGYRDRERLFQKTVNGRRMSMPQLRGLIGGAVVVPQKLLFVKQAGTEKKRVQVYYDEGEGFTEANSFFPAESYDMAGSMTLELELPSTVKQVRIDPAMLPCITTIKEVVLNGEALPITDSKFIIVNGKLTIDKEAGSVTATFGTSDPNIYIRVSDRVKSTGNAFSLTMQTVVLPEEMAKSLEKELRRKIRL